jgi:hypothetical protein
MKIATYFYSQGRGCVEFYLHPINLHVVLGAAATTPCFCDIESIVKVEGKVGEVRNEARHGGSRPSVVDGTSLALALWDNENHR